MNRRMVLIMAGGTGGHVFPGLAVADFLKVRGWQVAWMGNPESMEARLVPQHGYDMAFVRVASLRGKGLLRMLLMPLNLLRAFAQAIGHLRRLRPDVVLGLGGYVSFPGGMMASLLGRPLVIHEQNAVAGLANRVLAQVADRVLTGFPDVLRKGEWCGNPVRRDIAALPAPEDRYGGRAGPLRVLVVGGSLGAQALNDTVPRALALLTPEERPAVIHQSGARNLDMLQASYAEAGVSGELLAFIDDMAGQYAQADLVICRAGALTVAELAAAGVASILVPFPLAVDDHQSANARFLTDRGGAILLPQTELNPQGLADVLKRLDRTTLMHMAIKARAASRPEATATVAQRCAELTGASLALESRL